MATLLEQARGMHAEIEQLERMIAKELGREVRTHKERVTQGHRAARMLDEAGNRAAKLRRIYADEDGARKEEVYQLGGGKSGEAFQAFYDRLKEVREFHRRYPNLAADRGETLQALEEEDPGIEFTGEEASGKRLDLHAQHHQWQNAPFGARDDYLTFLKRLPECLTSVERQQKLSAQYRSFVAELLSYLEGFHHRAKPLTFLSGVMRGIEQSFPSEWEEGKVEGWEDVGKSVVQEPEPEKMPIDLAKMGSYEDVANLGMDTLKEALKRLGLKAGGTHSERADRLYRVKDTPLDQVDPKLKAKRPGAPTADAEAREKRLAQCKQVALQEVKIRHLLRENLRQELQNTVSNAERKQTLSFEELQAEAEEGEEAEGIGEEEEEEESRVHNPLKLPLGWDGKPIPYWLYKLHGLNIEYKCEICGNYSYWGRRAYERHFKEWRHQYGLRCLGIPNTKAFLEVTSIDEALRLNRHLQEQQKGQFRPTDHEECEDSEGNVYSRKTYEDLRRQGLI